MALSVSVPDPSRVHHGGQSKWHACMHTWHDKTRLLWTEQWKRWCQVVWWGGWGGQVVSHKSPTFPLHFPPSPSPSQSLPLHALCPPIAFPATCLLAFLSISIPTFTLASPPSAHSPWHLFMWQVYPRELYNRFYL